MIYHHIAVDFRRINEQVRNWSFPMMKKEEIFSNCVTQDYCLNRILGKAAIISQMMKLVKSTFFTT